MIPRGPIAIPPAWKNHSMMTRLSSGRLHFSIFLGSLYLVSIHSAHDSQMDLPTVFVGKTVTYFSGINPTDYLSFILPSLDA